MKKTLVSLSAVAAALAFSSQASAQDVEVSASIDFTTEYVFRGVSLGAESIQPGVEVAIGDFYAGVWGSTGVGEESFLNADEIDFYAGYGFAFSETISADIGATLYHYPQAGEVFDIGTDPGDASTFEAYGGLSFAVPFDPSVYVYYDLTLETFTIEGSGGYSFPLGEDLSLDLSAALGNVQPDGGGDYTYGSLGAALSYAFGESSAVYASVTAGASSEDTFIDWEDLAAGNPTAEDSGVWFGVGLSTSFD